MSGDQQLYTTNCMLDKVRPDPISVTKRLTRKLNLEMINDQQIT